ncbi:hypothetical protein [Streptomyces sp. JW3]
MNSSTGPTHTHGPSRLTGATASELLLTDTPAGVTGAGSGLTGEARG